MTSATALLAPCPSPRRIRFVLAMLVAGSGLAHAADPAPANTWVKLNESATGGRSSCMFFYEPALKQFFLAGGLVNGERHFDVEIFDPATNAWTNAYPAGAPYKNAAGVTDAPPINEGDILQSKDGIWRLATYSNGYRMDTRAHHQWSYDPDSQRLFAYLLDKTLSYDVTKRAWADTGAAKFSPTGRFSMVWGNFCYDPVNREVLSIGGTSDQPGGTPGTWVFKIADNAWQKIETGTLAFRDLRDQATALRRRGWALLSACRGRYFIAETEAEAHAKLSERAATLGIAVESLADKLGKAALAGGEAVGTKRAATLLADALAKLRAAVAGFDAAMSPEIIASAEAVHDLLELAEYALAPEPPGRAHSQPVYAAKEKKIVLFGGNGQDRCYADTWVYDCKTRTWEQRYPKSSPSPRAGHAMVYLPRSGAVVLAGGYANDGVLSFRFIPHQLWIYDVAGNEWKLLLSLPGTKDDQQPSVGAPHGDARGNYGGGSSPWLGAATADDVLVMVDTGGKGRATWSCAVDPSKTDAAVVEKLDVPPGTMLMSISPAAWEKPANKPDPAATAEFYRTLPVNQWTLLTAPVPVEHRAWGTTAYDPDRQQLLYWGGGHVTYMGTDVAHGSIRADRWTLGYSPDLPVEPVGGFAVKAMRSFQDRPQIPLHAYRAYAYDQPSGKLFCLDRSYDVAERQWDPQVFPGLKHDGTMNTLLEATPAGVVALSKFGLFRFEWPAKAWRRLTVDGPGFNAAWCDGHALIYDSKRNCLWSGTDRIYTYDCATGKSVELAVKRPKRLREFALWEEQAFIPGADLILLQRRFPGPDGKETNVAFDTQQQKYYAVDLPFSDGKPHNFSWSSALNYDAKLDVLLLHDEEDRKGNLWVLRLERKTAAMIEISE